MFWLKINFTSEKKCQLLLNTVGEVTIQYIIVLAWYYKFIRNKYRKIVFGVLMISRGKCQKYWKIGEISWEEKNVNPLFLHQTEKSCCPV